ncbi:hypothetical protein P389DRAFT_169799 [Cystobasidium minutum MCA 4210]|uniref:uncharacterized protein n=1 Tax=Cystobasidium minutum MCA 4210 TaxID=1397322 RepID=UPI0034CD8919|eukprot:jgi/Rhomi1/169799/fgenesh1_kg.3_\
MHKWTPTVRKEKFNRHRSQISEQVNRFNEADPQATRFADGRRVRQFESPPVPYGYAQKDQRNTIQPAEPTSSSDDDDEEVLIIRKVTVAPDINPKPTITLDKDGWYDWQILPSVGLHSLGKEDTANSKLAPSDPITKGVNSYLRDTVQALSLANDSTTTGKSEHEDLTIYEEFCRNLEDLNDETKSQRSAASFVSAASAPVVQVNLPKAVFSQGTDSSSAIQTPTSGDEEYEDADESAPRPTERDISAPAISANNSGSEEASQAEQRASFQTVNDEELAALYHVEASLAHERAEAWAYQDSREDQYADAEESEAVQLAPSIPTTSLEHSRQQTRRLRLYSTLYADFARDPWQWHDNRDAVRDLFPRLQREYPKDQAAIIQRSTLNRQTSASARPAVGPQHPVLDEHNSSRHDSGHANADGSSEPLRASESVLLPGLDTLTSDRGQYQDGHFVSKKHRPLEGSEYCFKCRRHFKNTWRMQKHLADSRIHPYYCQICTVDFYTFKELYMHYAEQPKCRPPELEFGPAMPFLQILADYQITGQKEAARLQSALDAKEALDHAAFPLRQASKPQARSDQAASSRQSEPPACPICMVPLASAKEVLATACGHVYCSSCILHYFSKERPNCPKCRTPVSKATLIPLELH